MIALAELHLLNQDLDACQSILQTVLKNNKDNDQATLVCNIYQYLFLSLREVYDPKAFKTSTLTNSFLSLRQQKTFSL